MRYLGTIFFISVIAFGVYDFINDAVRDESGSVISEGQIDVFTMRAGDCFNDPEAAEFEDVAGIPCFEPHDNEVYAVFDVSFDKFPGEETMSDAATDECLKRFKKFVGRPYEDSVLDIFPIYPTDDSWSRVNDREVICAIYHMDGEKLTGSNKGSGI